MTALNFVVIFIVKRNLKWYNEPTSAFHKINSELPYFTAPFRTILATPCSETAVFYLLLCCIGTAFRYFPVNNRNILEMFILPYLFIMQWKFSKVVNGGGWMIFHFFDCSSPFSFLLIEFHWHFSISFKIINYVYYYCIFIRYSDIGRRDFFFVPAIIIITILTPLFLPSYSLFLYLISFLLFPCTSVWVHGLDKLSCTHSQFKIAILNGTIFFQKTTWSQCCLSKTIYKNNLSKIAIRWILHAVWWEWKIKVTVSLVKMWLMFH